MMNPWESLSKRKTTMTHLQVTEEVIVQAGKEFTIKVHSLEHLPQAGQITNNNNSNNPQLCLQRRKTQ
jgi:hypothetical protein